MIAKIVALSAILFVCAALTSCDSPGMPAAKATGASYGFRQFNLVADIPGTAPHTDPGLLNPWGVAFRPAQPFFIANNDPGDAKAFDPSGVAAIPLAVGIPISSGSLPPSKPKGVVFNPTAQDFLVRGTPSRFLFATEDGTISTWASINGNNPTFALLARDARGLPSSPLSAAASIWRSQSSMPFCRHL